MAPPRDPDNDGINNPYKFVVLTRVTLTEDTDQSEYISSPKTDTTDDQGFNAQRHVVEVEGPDECPEEQGDQDGFRDNGCPENPAPSVSLSGKQVNEGGEVTLSADATDLEGEDLSYNWKLSGQGSLNQNGETATYQAPNSPGGITSDTDVTISVTVSEPDESKSSSDSTTVTVNDVNPSPSVSLSGKTVKEGQQVTLRVDANNPEGDGLTYEWSKKNGPGKIKENGQTATYYAPSDISSDKSASVSVTVKESEGKSDAANAQVTVNNNVGNDDDDNDGIPNSEDAAPDEPEDEDNYQDNDGAPDTDNDGDGIKDSNDDEPNTKEDTDSCQDGDGASEPDGTCESDDDGDGILNRNDEAPNEPEDKDDYQDNDGVPDPDNDGDGIKDSNDDEPNTKEDTDGCQDDDGASEPDGTCSGFSVFELTVDAPSSVTPGESIKVTYTIKNTGDTSLDSLGLQVTDVSSDLTVTSIDSDEASSISQDKNTVFFPAVEPGESVSVTLHVEAASDASGEQTLRVKATNGVDSEQVTRAVETPISVDRVPDAEFEPNDNLSTATQIAPDEDLSGLQISGADLDVYRIDLTEGETLKASINFDHDTADLQLVAANKYQNSTEKKNVYNESVSRTDGESVTITAVKDEPYYIIVGPRNNNTADYSLSTTVESDTPGETASVTLKNQTSDGTQVVVESATFPEGGFIALYNTSGFLATVVPTSGTNFSIAHSSYLSAGTHTNITLTLDNPIHSDSEIVALLLRDSDSDQMFDGDGEQTYTYENGTDVYDSANVAVKQSSDIRIKTHKTCTNVTDEGICPSGTETTQFTYDDDSVYSLVTFPPFSGTHDVTMEWYTPSGNLYETFAWTATDSDDDGFWAWSWLSIQDDMPAGEWRVEIIVDGEKRSIRTFELSDGSPSGRTLKLKPTNTEVEAGSTTTLNVVLTNADDGVGAFDNITATVTDSSVATIMNVEPTFTSANVGTTSDGKRGYVNVPFGGNTGTGDVTLATITVEGNTRGTTSINLSLRGDIADEGGGLYAVENVVDASLTVTESESSAITGQVINEENTPIENATVTLYRVNSGGSREQIGQLVTSAVGSFSFTELSPGEYILRAEIRNKTGQATIQAEPGTNTADIAIDMSAATFSTDRSLSSQSVQPGGTITVTTTISPKEARSRVAVTEEYGGFASVSNFRTDVEGPGSVLSATTSDSSATIALQNLDPNSTVTITYDLHVNSSAELGTTREISGTITSGSETTSISSTTVAIERQSVLARYAGRNNVIDTPDLQKIITDWATGQVSTSKLQQAITAWATREAV